MNDALPKKLATYIHETGVKALDHLAEGVLPPAEGTPPDALQTLAANWRSMSDSEKEVFVDRVAASVGEVIAASAVLPIKSARKALKKTAKTRKKAAKAKAKAAAKKKKKKKS